MRHHIGLPVAKPREEIVARYKQLRSVGIRLNTKLVKRLTKEMLEEGARKLGILVDGVMVFDSEDESSVLMDYCLYHVERKGRNTVEQYLIDSPPDPDSDEMTCLRAMQYARYCVLIVESILPGYGVQVRDLLSDVRFDLLDLGFSQTAVPGVVLATRVQDFGDFIATGGAGVPLGKLPLDDSQLLSKFTHTLRGLFKPEARGNIDPAVMLRARLESDGGARIRYEDPSAISAGPKWKSRSSNAVSAHRVPRNALCPCGSGKKYKQCCMKR